MTDLADRAVGFPELSGGAELADRLPETAVRDRRRLVADWLRARTESHDRTDTAGVRALQRIEEGAPSVGALAAELGCSRGHLHRVVRSWTGQSPSTLLRVSRLHRLVALSGTERVSPVPGRCSDAVGVRRPPAPVPRDPAARRPDADPAPRAGRRRPDADRGDLTTSQRRASAARSRVGRA